jgi:hypothetical protein
VENGDGKKCPPQAFEGIFRGEFFLSENEDEELFSDGEFPIAIPIQPAKGIFNSC